MTTIAKTQTPSNTKTWIREKNKMGIPAKYTIFDIANARPPYTNFLWMDPHSTISDKN